MGWGESWGYRDCGRWRFGARGVRSPLLVLQQLHGRHGSSIGQAGAIVLPDQSHGLLWVPGDEAREHGGTVIRVEAHPEQGVALLWGYVLAESRTKS